MLNDYDQETADFYRWRVEYSQKELATLISEKSKEDFGHIIDLIPLDRGKSGRIWRLKIVGSKKTLIIGKELEIRRTLSKSHLYSSAFVVDRDDIDADGMLSSPLRIFCFRPERTTSCPSVSRRLSTALTFLPT